MAQDSINLAGRFVARLLFRDSSIVSDCLSILLSTGVESNGVEDSGRVAGDDAGGGESSLMMSSFSIS